MGKPAASKKKQAHGFIMTIEDGDKVQDIVHSDSDTDAKPSVSKKTSKKVVPKSDVNADFSFSIDDSKIQEISGRVKHKNGVGSVWNFAQVKKMMKPKARDMGPSIDELIARYCDIPEDVDENAEDDNMDDEEDVKIADTEDEDFSAGETSDRSEVGDDSSEPESVDQDEEMSADEADIDALEDRESEMIMSDNQQSDSDECDEEEDRVMDKRRADYFEAPEDSAPTSDDIHKDFNEMNLSRPLIRGLSDIGFSKPTRIQSMTIPVALMGKDICGAASTGSGKTAAFLLPIFERLLYRPKSTPATRVLILTPTRELAAQCHSVGLQLAKYTDLTFSLCVGGASNKDQERELRNRPDVVIATPGRLIDHIQNSKSFGLEALEILVMDEADRMLEEGFEAELTEIIRDCPRNRQTLLFSATMTDNVDQLIRLSLNRPVRLFIDSTQGVTQNLTQEFIRIRIGGSSEVKSRELDDAERVQREALCLAICKRTYTRRAIIFCPSKIQCHRLKILFALNKLLAVELHGNLTQIQRLEALEKFRDGEVEFLIATDLAARGLDIAGVETVINFQMPQQYDRYVHRVGRTARHLSSGKAVTLVGERERKMVKTIMKHLKPGQVVKQRVVPPSVVQKMRNHVAKLESAVADILNEEKEEHAIQKAEMTLQKAQNMLDHADEIYARPPKEWFQSEKEKLEQKQRGMQALQDSVNGVDESKTPKSVYEEEMEKELSKAPKRKPLDGLSRKQKRRKMMIQSDKEGFVKNDAAQKIAAKHAKKAARSGIKLPVTAGKKKSRNNKSGKLQRGFENDLSSGKKSGIIGGKAGRKVPNKKK